MWRDGLLFIPRVVKLVGGLAADGRLPRGVRLRIGAALLYLAMPIDIIPDWIPGLGHLDDVIVAAVLLDALFRSVPEDILHSHWGGPPRQLERLARASRVITWLVPRAIRRRIYA